MSVRAYLQLMRFPAVFTAMADVFLGFTLNRVRFADDPWALGLLVAASSCLYLAGMIFNDVFDRQVDAQERPNRPIPSGRVSVPSAIALGAVLILAGIGAASTVGLNSLFVAVLLTAFILAYDGWAKKTVFGPVVMGGCRFLNVILGASSLPRAFQVWGISPLQSPQLWIATGLGIYIAGVTWFARQEAKQSDRRHLMGALTVANAGLLLLLGWVVHYTGGRPDQTALSVGFGVILLFINRQPVLAVRDPRPQRVQGAVRVMLMSLIMLDAMLVFIKTENAPAAVIVAALLIPATYLGRWIFVT